MYNLILHIEYLLLKHDCVTVPGFGALINVRQPASYDEKRCVWKPMTREIRFNQALNHDDGLLANSFARKEQVSFAEGRELLRRSTLQLTETLRNEGEVTLGHIGSISNENGTLIFTPQYPADKLSDILGYTEACTKHATRASDSITASKPQLKNEIQGSESLPDLHRFDTERNYYIAVNKVFARVAACVAIILITSMAFILPTNRHTHVDKASVIPMETIIRKADPIVELTKEPASPKAALVVSETTSEEKAGRYHAIVATFATEREARNFIESSIRNGYELKVVKGRTKSRVSAFSSDSRSEVVERINDKKFRSAFGDSWIWDAE